MAKYLDLKVGKKLKVYKFNWGNSQNGAWALFSFTPYETDEKGNTTYGQNYTIIISNYSQLNCAIGEGDMVEIDKINSVTTEYTSYKSKATGQMVNKTVVKVAIDIKIPQVANNYQQPQNQVPQNYQDNNGIEYPFPVDDENDDFNMPNF